MTTAGNAGTRSWSGRLLMAVGLFVLAFWTAFAFAESPAGIAGRIAAGHAYDKHVVAEGQFPGVASRAAFAAVIQGIIEHPTAARPLSSGRTAYWDAASGAVVIANPHDRDGGTCFKPRAGRAYFDNLH